MKTAKNKNKIKKFITLNSVVIVMLVVVTSMTAVNSVYTYINWQNIQAYNNTYLAEFISGSQADIYQEAPRVNLSSRQFVDELKITFEKPRSTSLKYYPLATGDDETNFTEASFTTSSILRTHRFMLANSLVIDGIDSDTNLLAGCISPFTVTVNDAQPEGSYELFESKKLKDGRIARIYKTTIDLEPCRNFLLEIGDIEESILSIESY